MRAGHGAMVGIEDVAVDAAGGRAGPPPMGSKRIARVAVISFLMAYLRRQDHFVNGVIIRWGEAM